MKVVMATGSYPPDVCGVGDYVESLESALIAKGVEVEIVTSKHWGVTDVLNLVARFRNGIPHLQYPTVGYGRNLGPQFLSLLVPSIVTLHEFKRVHWLRKVSSVPFGIRSSCVVFTTESERKAAVRKMPWLNRRSQVIPIGSSISPSPRQEKPNSNEIVYFGLVVPKKGLETIVHLAKLIRLQGLPFRIRVIGSVVPEWRGFVEELISDSHGLPLEFTLNRSREEVSEMLSKAFIAYLPFPDGATERRSSMKAVLAAGVPCISTVRADSGVELRETILPAETPDEALRLVQQLVANPSLWNYWSTKSLEYARSFAWSGIADRHIALYSRIQAAARPRR